MNASTALETAVKTAFLGVGLAFDNLEEDYEHNGFDRIDFAHTLLEQVTALDTAHDWTEQVGNTRHAVNMVKKDLGEALAAREAEEAELAASFLREMEEPLRNVRSAADSLKSLYDSDRTVSRFTAETVGNQNPEQFDWDYFEGDLGDMESVFAATFEGSGDSCRVREDDARSTLQIAGGRIRESGISESYRHRESVK